MTTVSNSLDLRIASIREHVTIFEVFERMGIDEPPETHQMKCPFHADRSPSARVFADQNKIYCFTCQRGWDVIDAVQTHWKLSPVDAVVWIEQEFAVPGGLQSLTGMIRTKLSSRAAPDVKAMAQVVEQTLQGRRVALGFDRYTRCLMALDLSVYEATETKTLKAADLHERMQAILKAGTP